MTEAAIRYHTACPTLKAFIRQHRITMSAAWADSNPNIDSMPPGSRHWRCTLRCGHRRLTVYFSQGPAIEHEPTVEDVLDCLASDASGCADTFEDWCAELGYDSDSRKAEQTFQLIREQNEKLAALLGPAFGECSRSNGSDEVRGRGPTAVKPSPPVIAWSRLEEPR